jgi:uncharacterized membrane protein YdbT with pleckstrin-like domain
MPFPRKLLTSGEDVLLELHPHWKALVAPGLLTVVLWAGATLLINKIDASAGWVVFALAAVLWLWLAVAPVLQWRFTEYVLTNERLISRAGVIAKRTTEIPLERINDITITQSVFERILHCGDLVLESAGEFGQQRFSDVGAPAEVQKRIYEATEVRKGIDARGSAPSVADELSKLAELRDRGVLTDAEFQARKSKLLKS